MSRQLLIEYILEPELLFLATDLLISERPGGMQRRRMSMKSGAFSALVKEGNHFQARRPIQAVQYSTAISSSILRTDHYVVNPSISMRGLARSDNMVYYRRIRTNDSLVRNVSNQNFPHNSFSSQRVKLELFNTFWKKKL